jgi:hypothetical protein
MLPIPLNHSTSEQPGFHLAKLAKLHGYHSAKNMLKAYDLRFPQKAGRELLQYNHIISSLNYEAQVFDNANELEFDAERYFKSMVHPNVQVCPQCLIEGKAPFEHRYIMNTHCHEHSSPLIDTCKHCQSKLEWESSLVDVICNKCGKTLESTSEALPTLQLYLSVLDEKKLKHFLHDLSLAASYILRPLDAMPESIPTRYVNSWAELFNQAFELLTSKNVLKNWLMNIFHNKSNEVKILGSDAIFSGPINLLASTKMDWPVLENITSGIENFNPSTEFIEMPNFSPEYFGFKPSWKTKNKLIREQNDDAIFRVYPSILAKIIGCSFNCILELINDEIIKPSNRGRAANKFAIDLRRVDGLFNEGLLTPTINMQKLKDEAYYYTFDTSYSDILSLILNHHLPFHLENSKGNIINRLKISSYSLTKKLLINMNNKVERKLKEDEIEGIFGLNKRDLKALTSNDILSPMPWLQLNVYYRLKDVIAVKNQLFNLAWYCKTRNLDLESIKIQLSEINIKPVIGSNLFSCGYQIKRFLKFGIVVEPKRTFTIKKKNKFIW